MICTITCVCWVGLISRNKKNILFWCCWNISDTHTQIVFHSIEHEKICSWNLKHTLSMVKFSLLKNYSILLGACTHAAEKSERERAVKCWICCWQLHIFCASLHCHWEINQFPFALFFGFSMWHFDLLFCWCAFL